MAKGMRRDAVHPEGISEEDALQYAQRLARPDSARATQLLYRSYFRAIGAGVRGEPRPRLAVPTRVLFGVNDGFLSPEVVRGGEGHADDLKVQLVEDSGHFIPEEKPELVAHAALELFGGVRARG
jgi:pimeloyl-ACP methyl ester carboxylesterase